METQDTGVSAAEAAREFVLGVLAAMEMQSDVEVQEQEEGGLLLEVVGEDAGDVIGRYGDGLNSLQYLATLVTLRRTGEHVRLTLDAEGYRDRRLAALTEQARELAAEVQRSGQEAELDPLSSFERRIIHNALLDHPEVVTYSEGEEPERRIVIAPRPKRGRGA
jgi:spoIIIJ-associated protein